LHCVVWVKENAGFATLWLCQCAHVRRRSPTASFPYRRAGVPGFGADFSVIAGEARPAQIAEALAWAKSHQEGLALRWVELNERG
jgi:hypothetical protein